MSSGFIEKKKKKKKKANINSQSEKKKLMKVVWFISFSFKQVVDRH
jgi:hypothetical protein